VILHRLFFVRAAGGLPLRSLQAAARESSVKQPAALLKLFTAREGPSLLVPEPTLNVSMRANFVTE